MGNRFIFTVLLIQLLGICSHVKAACPTDPQGVSGFDITKFSGKWYTYETTPPIFFGEETCNSGNYVVDGQNLKLDLKSMVKDGDNYKAESLQFIVEPMEGDGKYNAKTLDGSVALAVIFPEMDYDNYGIIYSCGEGTKNEVLLAGITRDRVPQDTSKIDQAMKRFKAQLGNVVTQKESQVGCDE